MYEQTHSFPPTFTFQLPTTPPGGPDQQEWRGVALIELMVRRASAYEVGGIWVDSGGPNPKAVTDGLTKGALL